VCVCVCVCGAAEQVLNPGKHAYRSEMEMITRGGWFDPLVCSFFMFLFLFLFFINTLGSNFGALLRQLQLSFLPAPSLSSPQSLRLSVCVSVRPSVRLCICERVLRFLPFSSLRASSLFPSSLPLCPTWRYIPRAVYILKRHVCMLRWRGKVTHLARAPLSHPTTSLFPSLPLHLRHTPRR